MSRFFRGGDSSESSASEEEELYSEEEEDEKAQKEDSDNEDGNEDENDSDAGSEAGANRQGASRFMFDDASSESEDSEAEGGKVKSAKDKRFEELEATITAIQNGQKINDWGSIANEFDKLNRQVEKLTTAGKVPKAYIKCVVELEAFMNETIAKQKVTPKKKQMTATNARGFNAVKQKLKKASKESQEQIEAYNKDPDAFMESEQEEEQPKPKTTKVKFTPLTTEQGEEDDDEGFATVGKGGRTLQFTAESILKHLRTIMETRGKKNTDRMEQIKIMEKLYEVAQTPYQQLRVLMTLVSARFDMGSTASAMPLEQWKAAEKELRTLLEILAKKNDHVIIEGAEEWEDDDKQPALEPGQKHIKIPGSVVSLIERLDDELTRSLQQIDPHTSEYIERLTDEGLLYNIIFQCLLYYEMISKDANLTVPQDSLCRVVQRRLDHVYFKPAQVVNILEENAWQSVPAGVASTISPRHDAQDAEQFIATLCNYLFDNSDGIIRARAMLCRVYFMALHDHYYKAREMMLTSHLQETIVNFDVQSQILYNRTLVQVGLCAFRKGLVYDAQNTLQEICGSGRQKELLAQGVMMQRYGNQVSAEQERLEKQRQLPFHMHINLELLECVYLTCSMLLEIPLLAQTGSSPDIRKRIISKTYRRMLEYHERQIFTGPPENTRDHVMQASKALAAGEWRRATTLIHSIKIWDLMPSAEQIKAMLATRIQEEGLRTYLFTYAPFYDTLAVATLSDMFDLAPAKVSVVVSKMISHEELAAALDQVTSTIIFRKGVELSRLQSLSLALSDKASQLIETNERTLEIRTQGSQNAFTRKIGPGQRGGPRGQGGPRTGGGPRQSGPRQAGGTQFTGGALGVR